MKTLIVVPIYNEVPTIRKMLEHLDSIKKKDEELLIVDDGSRDGSSEIISQFNSLKKITHRKNFGYGKSLIDGFDFAIEGGYDLVITLDCDFQHRPELIPVFKEKIKQVDILSGSRYKHGVTNGAPQDRVRINGEITKLINKNTSLNITDAFCGFKAYKVESLEKLELSEWGYGMPVQMWVQVDVNDLEIKEYPVEAIYCNEERNFKGQFRNPKERLSYYKKVFNNEISKLKEQNE